MADEVAFVPQGLSASIAEVVNLPSGGFSVKQEGGASLLRISQAFCILVDGLLSSLEEFRYVERALELETAAGSPDLSQTNVSVEVPRPELLLGVACALKEMVGALVSDIKVNAEVQKLMPAIQKASAAEHHAFFQDLIISKPQQSSPGNVVSPPREETLVCTSSENSRMARRAAAGKGQMSICEHSCEHHQEVVDPWLWRNLPQELVELIFAKLPLPLIVGLRECSQAWYTMSKTSSIFSEACSESHPVLFGLVRWDILAEALWTTFYDVKSKEWLFVEWAGFPGSRVTYNTWEPDIDYEDPGAYRKSLYACDGGLICFVPISYGRHLTSLPIMVCNPLISTWKTLPLTPVEDFEKWKIVMVQLVVEVDRNIYRVVLVSRENIGTAFSAHFYSSETGIWSTMDSGLVYGAGCCYLWGAGHPGAPYVFDCTTMTLFDLRRSASLANVGVLWYSQVNDDLFVLHESNVRGQRDAYMYLVSEYVWESSVSNLIKINVSESPVKVFRPDYKYMFFASPGFVLLFADNCEKWDEDHHQLVGLYDVGANRWEVPPPMPCGSSIHHEQLDLSFMV